MRNANAVLNYFDGGNNRRSIRVFIPNGNESLEIRAERWIAENDRMGRLISVRELGSRIFDSVGSNGRAFRGGFRG